MTKMTEFFYPASGKEGNAQIHAAIWEPEESESPHGILHTSHEVRDDDTLPSPRGIPQISYGMKNDHFSPSPRGILQISHGMTEYILRYQDIARFFAGRGYIVAGSDHPGHGQSVIPGAKPMYFGKAGSWRHVVEDMHILHEKLHEQYPELPCYLLGFSLGSFLSRDYVSRYPADFRGIVLAGTGQPSAAELLIAEAAAKREVKKYGAQEPTPLIHKLTFESYNRHFQPAKTDMDWLCENTEALEKYLSDPVRGESMSSGMFLEFVHGMQYVCRKSTAAKMNPDVPVLFVSGKSDPVGNFGKGVAKALKMFREAGIQADMRLYDGRHDILREKSAENVMEDIASFLGEIR